MYKYLLYFLIFSFLGWCSEVLFHLFKTGRLVNRGLAHGPVCPIYGVGICLCELILGGVESFILLVLLSMAIATAVELTVGYITDRFLSRRLWDYTAEEGNILGYICPRFSLIWGVICATVIRLMPIVDRVIERYDGPLLKGVSFVLLTVVLMDIKTAMLKPSKKREIA